MTGITGRRKATASEPRHELRRLAERIPNTLNEPVLLRDAPGPATGEQISKRLQFARARKRIPQRCFDQIQDPKRGASVCS